MDIQIGDKVRFLNAVGGGKVTGFQKGGIVLVEDEDGFDIPVRSNEIVVVPADNRKAYDEAPKKQSDKPQNGRIKGSDPLMRPSTPQTTFGAQSASQGGQPTAFASAQAAAEHEAMEKRIIQLEMKVHDLELRLERLEAIRQRNENKKNLSSNELLPFGGGGGGAKSKPNQKPELIEVDLHINELLDTTAGMSAADMKAYQLKVFRETMEANKSKKGQRIVFIHGNGEGVLRKAIIDELKYAYKTCEWQDASFQQYGFGATMVIVH